MHEIYSKITPDVNLSNIRCIKGFEKIKADFSDYLSDESKLTCKPFEYLFFPKNEAELSCILKEMGKSGVSITVASARTGLVGGSVPEEGALVSLEYLDKVEAVYYNEFAQEWRVRAQAGVSLKNLDHMLRFKSFPQMESSVDPNVGESLEKFKGEPDTYFYPPDPTEMSASLGGSIVTNASGARTYRYGPTRAWVRAIRVFLANGEYLDIPRGKYFASPAGKFVVYESEGKGISFSIPDYAITRTKNTTGVFTAPQMDLIDLFIGSEGVLGIITQAEVALLKREDKISIIQFLDSDEQAIKLTEALRSDSRLRLDFLEFYSGNALNLLRTIQQSQPSIVGMPIIPEFSKAAIFIEMDFDPHAENQDFSALEEIVTGCGGSLSDSWAGYESRELDRFKVFRHLIPETINAIIAERKKKYPGLHKLGTDLAVPDEYLREIWELYKNSCEDTQLEWAAFGHIGNNHIHVNIMPRDMEDLQKGLELYSAFAKTAVAMGGAVSAEHGIGKMKGKFLKLMYSENQIDQMRQLKLKLDPQGLLNPNNIFPLEASR
jgi:D-lactate dehydrogenase (cytochrome)